VGPVSALLGTDTGARGAAVDRAAELALPSVAGLVMTLTALDSRVSTVADECRDISVTLTSLGDAMQVLGQGGSGGQEWGGFGIIGLPIAGAIRAAKGLASQYVKQQTGTPLSTWTGFISSSEDQFASFLAALDTVGPIAQRYRASADDRIEAEQAREDVQALTDIRWELRAWKLVLGRVAQLGQVVDAILKVDVGAGAEAVEPDAPPAASGLGSSLQRRLKEVQGRTVDRSGDLGHWFLRPFVDVRDKVRQLPGQVSRLSAEVGSLEVLLELVMAEIRACLREISSAEAQVVGVRVAAAVLLPQLSEETAEVQQRVVTYQGRLDRLRHAREEGAVDERVCALLAEEYTTALQSAQSRCTALGVQADLWRRHGPAVLDACAGWLALELDLLAARQLAGETETFEEHRVLLQRERSRLDEARLLLASL
jgi:hypothetical protein